MKNFLATLCMVVLLASLVAVLIASMSTSSQGAEALIRPVLDSQPHFSALPVKYPDSVKKMTNAEFYKWATKENKIREDAWFSKASTLPSRTYTSNGIVHKGVDVYTSSGNTHILTTPKNSTSTYSRESYEVRHQFVNPNYKWQGPLTIINPYVKPN